MRGPEGYRKFSDILHATGHTFLADFMREEGKIHLFFSNISFVHFIFIWLLCFLVILVFLNLRKPDKCSLTSFHKKKIAHIL